MSDWKTLSKNPDEWKSIKYDDPRLDAFATEVEKKHGLPKGMLVALKNAGEKTNPGRISPVGARGVMQFMPKEVKKYKHNPDDPFQSINAAGHYMKVLIEENTRRWSNIHKDKPVDMKKVYMAAVANYNGGPPQARAVLRGQEPPAEESRNYVKRIREYLDTNYSRPTQPATVAEVPKQGTPIPKRSIPSKDELAKMSHYDLLVLRNELPDADVQKELAPYEHRAFAREYVEENPEAAATMAFMIPGYAASKAVGISDSRTPASMEQVQQGFVGVYEGLRKRLSK